MVEYARASSLIPSMAPLEPSTIWNDSGLVERNEMRAAG